MKIIACLGNPGKKYSKNRHNIGFIVGEYLLRKNSSPSFRSKFNSQYATCNYNGEEVVFLFPQTYMNKSGESVEAARNFFKLNVEDVIVIHDELELPFGDIRLKKGGGHKGHNGIRSIASVLGSPDFYRVRFGIGRPSNPNIPVSDFVLSDFTKDEAARLEELVIKVENCIDEIF